MAVGKWPRDPLVLSQPLAWEHSTLKHMAEAQVGSYILQGSSYRTPLFTGGSVYCKSNAIIWCFVFKENTWTWEPSSWSMNICSYHRSQWHTWGPCTSHCHKFSLCELRASSFQRRILPSVYITDVIVSNSPTEFYDVTINYLLQAPYAKDHEENKWVTILVGIIDINDRASATWRTRKC